ncbi:MAG: sulfotransferase [Bacteroidales bacterium]|nr:sulfotransferase [Bacteroidales bacterium]
MNPVFIVGISGRSGTNYLFRLLLNHPDCAVSNLGAEDFIIYGLDKLTDYTDKISLRWKKDWNYTPAKKSMLKKSLGDGITDFLRKDKNNKCLISKTPSTLNIDKFFDFFTDARLIILVRDGKNVVESGVKSKFWNYETGFHIWNESAKRILKLLEKETAVRDKILLIKYEDLVSSLDKELAKVFAFCHLSFDKYDFRKTENIQVFGSSLSGAENKKFVWKVDKQKKHFDPLLRTQKWNRFLYYRYNRKCGENAVKLGYELKNPGKGIMYYLTNLLWDIGYFYVKIKYAIKPI